MCQKSRSDRFLIHFYCKCFLKMFHGESRKVSEMCHLDHIRQISDSFPWQNMTVFRHIFYLWHFSEAFPKFVWHISDRVLNLTDFWHISDTFQAHFWQFFVTDRFLTLFRQFSDSFLKMGGPTFTKSTPLCV